MYLFALGDVMVHVCLISQIIKNVISYLKRDVCVASAWLCFLSSNLVGKIFIGRFVTKCKRA